MNQWQNLARKIAAAGLPTLGGVLAGPAGAAAGARVAQQLGLPDADPAVIAQAIDGDPEVMVRLREIDQQIAREAQAHVEKIIAAEEASVSEARTVTKGHWLTPVLSLVIIAMLCALGVGLFFVEPPQANRDMVNLMLGTVLGFAGATVAYWLGSSRGSADRAATLDGIASRK